MTVTNVGDTPTEGRSEIGWDATDGEGFIVTDFAMREAVCPPGSAPPGPGPASICVVSSAIEPGASLTAVFAGSSPPTAPTAGSCACRRLGYGPPRRRHEAALDLRAGTAGAGSAASQPPDHRGSASQARGTGRAAVQARQSREGPSTRASSDVAAGRVAGEWSSSGTARSRGVGGAGPTPCATGCPSAWLPAATASPCGRMKPSAESSPGRSRCACSHVTEHARQDHARSRAGLDGCPSHCPT